MSRLETFRTRSEDEGVRLDRYLTRRLDDISRSIISRLISEGHVLVDNATSSKALRLKPDQTVTIEIPEPDDADSEIRPQKIDIPVLYEDDDIAVINKPAGLCVHPAPGHLDGTIVNGLLHLYPKMAHVGSLRRPGVVHRLDLDTTGVMVFALSPRAYYGLVEMIKDRHVKREYLALTSGVPSATHGTIDKHLGRDPANRKKFRAGAPGVGTRHAVTHFEVEKRFREAALLRVTLDTGRTHQIRVHLASIGHPIVGDQTYGGNATKNFGINRQALHAERLAFTHPTDKSRTLDIRAPLPEDFAALIKRFERE